MSRHTHYPVYTQNRTACDLPLDGVRLDTQPSCPHCLEQLLFTAECAAETARHNAYHALAGSLHEPDEYRRAAHARQADQQLDRLNQHSERLLGLAAQLAAHRLAQAA